MNRNTWTVLITSAVFSLAAGIYEFVLPLFLENRRISFVSMGFIFGIAAVSLFFFRVISGRYSDRIGRKPVYTFSLVLAGISNIFTPVFSAVSGQIILKSLRETAMVIRETMRAVIVYENTGEKFLLAISRIIGLEFILIGLGALAGGFLISTFGFDFPFYFCGIALFLTFIYFNFSFRETKPVKNSPEPAIALKMSDFLHPDLPHQLKIAAFSFFVFNLGLSMSHSFYLPLFFIKKFNTGPELTALIMTIHRLVLGTAMFAYGSSFKKNQKSVYMAVAMLQGLTITVSTLIPGLTLAACIWLLHDVFGSIVNPLQNNFIQKFARSETRGKDVSLVQAIAYLGWIFGPIAAGFLVPVSVNAPFFVSGVVVMVSIFVMLWL